MKAVVFDEPGSFTVAEVDEPEVTPGHALVEVKSSTICATDQKILHGKFSGTSFPHIPGHEWSGRIVKVAPDVTGFQPGDRVGIEVHVGCGRCNRCLEGLYNLCVNYGSSETGHAHVGFTIDGGLAEYCNVPVKALHRLPDELSYDEGAWTDNIGIALYAVERSGLESGETVVVVGPGAYGLLSVQIARARAASRIILTGTRDSRLELGENLGADATVNVRDADDPVREVTEQLDGAGADVVIEFAGTGEAARQAIDMARRGGRVVLGGATGEGVELNVELHKIVRDHLDVLGSLANPKRISRRGLELIRNGDVKLGPLMTHHFELDEFPQAWKTFTERIGGAIRVMIHPDGGP